MKKYLALAVLFATVFHCASFATCRIYSLPARSSIAFRGEETKFADRVDIVVTVDSKDGRISSPFSITKYDKDKKQVGPTRVCGVSFASPEDVREIHAADLSGKDTELVIVKDDLSFEDGHFRLLVKKTDGEFSVVVDDLHARRLEAAAEKESARLAVEIKSAMTVNGLQTDWPCMDGDRKRYSSARKSVSADSPDVRLLSLDGALYQKGDAITIRFRLSRIEVESGKVIIAEGRVCGEATDDEIRNCRVTYESGEGSVDVSVHVRNAEEQEEFKLVKSEAAKEVLRKIAARERCLSLDLSYGTAKMNLDLNMEAPNVSGLVGGTRSLIQPR